MKTHFRIQLFVLIAFIVATTIISVYENEYEYWGFFYPIIGLSQLISAIILLISKRKMTLAFTVYSCYIFSVYAAMILGLLQLQFGFSNSDFGGIIIIYLIIALFISPIMAILFIHNLYDESKKISTNEGVG